MIRLEDRFRTAPATLMTDRFMTRFIKVGGIGVIAAVLGIFLFILLQILPLFEGAKVKPRAVINLPKASYEVLGADEWGELPFVVDQRGTFHFVDTDSGTIVQSVHPEIPGGRKVSAYKYSVKHQEIYAGTEDGFFTTIHIDYKPEFEDGIRTIHAAINVDPVLEILPGHPIRDLDYADAGDLKLVAAIQEVDGSSQVHIVTLVQEHTLFGSGDVTIGDRFNISGHISSAPRHVFVNSQADSVILTAGDGKVYYFAYRKGKIELRQIFKPFEDRSDPSIAYAGYLFGDVSLVFANREGLNRIYSLYIPEEKQERLYGLTKAFKNLPGPANYYHESVRNKAFLIGSRNYASIRYGTSERTRWESRLPFNVTQGLLGSKYNAVYLLDDQSRLHIYDLKDDHPEAGLKAFFGKVWYEGYNAPSYQWQSTGGTDEFEPKLSLIPLILGTLKGTFYALIFAMPIALLAAVYTSQFAKPGVRGMIKPVMEVMAALPSVVLGFLAALWLAPILETRIPSLLALFILIPAAALATGYFWTRLPVGRRKKIKPGNEWIVFIPILFFVSWIGWSLGGVIERLFFVVQDPETGARIADFRLWWVQATGAKFEQRNSLVVGFMMGFAVIPIIFTIAEDALSNVPKTLSAASLALGASRWQTAFHVTLPTAFPGIFSAAMIGFGRAVGETMIVVMATGNTPVMDFNIFSGFRTLSANIAVELPEAPYLGTLYRTLFLGALVLFVLTFAVNTFAELIRQHLREKYKTV